MLDVADDPLRDGLMPVHRKAETQPSRLSSPASRQDILRAMESLGHYLLRERIALPGVGAVEAFEGQDVRTGIDVLAFRPISEPLPALSMPHILPWIDQEGEAWIAEIPVGAVRTAWLAERIDLDRLAQWCKQLATVLHWAQEQNIPVGYVIPELVWARGSRVWLGGVGVSNPGHVRDFPGLLNTIKVLAGEAYPALPWREALEDYVVGHIDYSALVQQLEVGSEPLASKPSPPNPQTAPNPPRVDALEAHSARAGAEGTEDAVQDETTASSLEASDKSPAKAAAAPGAERQAHSKSLNVEVNQPTSPPATSTPPRRIRIEERLEPPFEVLEPPLPSRRAVALWIWLIPLVLLLAGLGWWVRSRTPSSTPVTVYPVEFRLQPPGPGASLIILEAPEGSQMPLNIEVAQLPGRVDFDRPGIYRIRVRVQGRVPVESLIEVPNPGGVTISLR
ncbi:hypothetical protein Mtai_v1c10300 [Meiothermus taiwanensis WR-220]|nr:hypothetical protein Mtai_v1c10300 [Meiothermus taiwanensis WR-220]